MNRTRYHQTSDYLRAVGRMLRSAGRRVGEADPEDLAQLIELRAILDEAIQAAVDAQRAGGITWESIGQATGTTRQAALMKWGRSA